MAATQGWGSDNKAHGKEEAVVTAAQSGGTKRGKQITEFGPFHFVVPFWFRGLIIAAIVSLLGRRSGQTCRQTGACRTGLEVLEMRAMKLIAKNIAEEG